MVMNSILEGRAYRHFSVVVEFPDGRLEKRRLPPKAYMGIVAAMNFKQRTRKMLEYYHADRLNCAVAGTSNRLETDQGFFVKLGDGAGDVKPIAHLYKTQVYQVGEYLGVPAEIRSRLPSPDTYSMEQSHEEFYFSVPYRVVDLCMYGRDNAVPVRDIALETGLTIEQVHMVLQDIDRKRLATQYLRMPPLVMEPGR
jgi:NAD+ synthase